MNILEIFNIEIQPWIWAPAVYFLWVTILLIVKKIVFDKIHSFAKRTKTQIDDIIVYSLDLPLLLLVFVSGALIINRIGLFERAGEFTEYFFVGLRVTAIFAIIIFFDRLIRSILKTYSDRHEILKTSGNVAQGIVRVIVMALGLLILLDSFGISITPLIASLGVGSLAVALALQPTLENFFAGVQLVVDKPIQVGQFVKLDSGEEGYVHKIGWRSTWVRMLPNNVVVIPNKMLISSKVLNYYYPEQEMAVLVQVGVHYDSDLEHVQKVTIEVGEETMKEVTGGVPEFKPFIRYHTFDDFSINFTVILRAKEFVDNYLVKHEFIKRLHRRYAKEGIVIPYPIRAINYAQEKAKE
jgi:small-conductance mechanosensitive channel